MAKTTLGKLPADAFGMLDLPKIDAAIIEGFRALPDLTGMSSDVMDELGIVGAIPASVLKPTDPKARFGFTAWTARIPRAANRTLSCSKHYSRPAQGKRMEAASLSREGSLYRESGRFCGLLPCSS